jgi:hypothetical protein
MNLKNAISPESRYSRLFKDDNNYQVADVVIKHSKKGELKAYQFSTKLLVK